LLSTDQLKQRIAATVHKQGPKWWANVRTNIPLVRRDLTELSPRNATTANLCSSGPSITSDIGFGDVFAAPTNYSFLMANEIVPDFLVSVDGSEAQGTILGSPRLDPSTTLLACPYTSPNLVRRASTIYWFHNFIQGPTDNPKSDPFGFNHVHQLLFPELKSWIIQAGCVANAHLIIAHYLAERAIAMYDVVNLNGYDFGYPPYSPITRAPLYISKSDECWTEKPPMGELEDPNTEWKQVTLPNGTRFMTCEIQIAYAHTFFILLQWGIGSRFTINNLSEASLLHAVPQNEWGTSEALKSFRDFIDDQWTHSSSEQEPATTPEVTQ